MRSVPRRLRRPGLRCCGHPTSLSARPLSSTPLAATARPRTAAKAAAHHKRSGCAALPRKAPRCPSQPQRKAVKAVARHEGSGCAPRPRRAPRCPSRLRTLAVRCVASPRMGPTHLYRRLSRRMRPRTMACLQRPRALRSRCCKARVRSNRLRPSAVRVAALRGTREAEADRRRAGAGTLTQAPVRQRACLALRARQRLALRRSLRHGRCSAAVRLAARTCLRARQPARSESYERHKRCRRWRARRTTGHVRSAA